MIFTSENEAKTIAGFSRADVNCFSAGYVCVGSNGNCGIVSAFCEVADTVCGKVNVICGTFDFNCFTSVAFAYKTYSITLKQVTIVLVPIAFVAEAKRLAEKSKGYIMNETPVAASAAEKAVQYHLIKR